MDLVIITENAQQYDVFHEAWQLVEKECNANKDWIGTVNIKIAYIAGDMKVPFSTMYPREKLEEYKTRRSGRAICDATIICGEIGVKDAAYLTYAMHQMLLGKILVVMKDPEQGSIPVFFAEKCKDPNYDSAGLAQDLMRFVKYIKSDVNVKHVS